MYLSAARRFSESLPCLRRRKGGALVDLRHVNERAVFARSTELKAARGAPNGGPRQFCFSTKFPAEKRAQRAQREMLRSMLLSAQSGGCCNCCNSSGLHAISQLHLEAWTWPAHAPCQRPYTRKCFDTESVHILLGMRTLTSACDDTVDW